MYDILKKSIKMAVAFFVLFGIIWALFYMTAMLFGFWLGIVIKYAF